MSGTCPDHATSLSLYDIEYVYVQHGDRHAGMFWALGLMQFQAPRKIQGSNITRRCALGKGKCRRDCGVGYDIMARPRLV